MWHWVCTNGVEATKCWVFIAHFSIYSTSRRHWRAGTDIPRLRGHTRQIIQVVRTVRHRISCCAPTIHWKCDAQIPNRQIKSPPALWKHLELSKISWSSDGWLKKVWISAIFSQIFWNYYKMKEYNRQICEDQIVTFKQSHILLYQGLLFLTRSTCVIVDARSHTCKSHDFIPRYDIIPDTVRHPPN